MLLASGDGFYVSDRALQEIERFPDGLSGPVTTPSVSPDGTAIAFEYQQQIWCTNIDGSGARELVFGSTRLRHPVWSPDGRAVLAYLSTPSADRYEPAIFFTDLDAERSYRPDLENRLNVGGETPTVNGPISWVN